MGLQTLRPYTRYFAARTGLVPRSGTPENFFLARVVETTAVPEPTGMLIMGAGLIGLGLFARKRGVGAQ